jgi:uncharacterized membrane protein affecting hemolysin expression
MSLFNNYRTYPQLTLCSVLLLVLGFLGAIFYLHNNDIKQHVFAERYGQMLATAAAHQAVDATLQQDMVSLQAILQEITHSEYVLGASLHNVDNKLLVQSGYKPNQIQQGRRYTFTAPVALHNNVAGYLEVTLEIPRRTAQDELFLMCWGIAVSLALLIIWWSIHRHWWSQFRDKIPSADSIVNKVVDSLPTIAEATESEPEPAIKVTPARVAVRVTMELVNIEKLYQQLNSEGFNAALRRFDKQLQGLLSLYNGQKQLLVGNRLLVDFTSEDANECHFRAVCFAQILLNMAARNPSPRLQLAAAIQPLVIHNNNSLAKEFIAQHNNPLTPAKNEVIICTSIIDDALKEHAEFDITRGKLLTIKPPYCDLLAKQEEQLLART